jgi:hypothetical protein
MQIMAGKSQSLSANKAPQPFLKSSALISFNFSSDPTYQLIPIALEPRA